MLYHTRDPVHKRFSVHYYRSPHGILRASRRGGGGEAGAARRARRRNEAGEAGAATREGCYSDKSCV